MTVISGVIASEAKQSLVLRSQLRVDHRRGTADDKGLVAFEEVRYHLGERFGPIGADRVARIVDENEVAVRHQLLVDVAHLGWNNAINRAEQDKGRCRKLPQLTFEIGIPVRSPQSHDE